MGIFGTGVFGRVSGTILTGVFATSIMGVGSGTIPVKPLFEQQAPDVAADVPAFEESEVENC